MTEIKTDAVVEVTKDGPYHVTGGVPLVRISKVESEQREPIDWKVDEDLGAEDEWWLCRCGNSPEKPFCTGKHEEGFDGTETAPTDTYAERAKALGGEQVTIKDDRSICTHAGFCANRVTNVWKAAKLIDTDADLREQMIGMVNRCPSGALTIEIDGEETEPETPVRIAVQTNGPLLVQGRITIRRSDGQPLEVRNRVALCRCGQSKIKPLCDGSHSDAGFEG